MKSYTLRRQELTQISETKFKCFLIIQETNNKGVVLKKEIRETATIEKAICFIETTLNKYGLLMVWS